ncbi:hypothetical protein ACLOJK_001735 [Asimina triloba]
MAQQLKMDGDKLFQKRDPEAALSKYEKALKLLPNDHVDMPYIHSHMAACYMEMGPGEWRKAIDECNLALEVSPKYSKALLKRARCYEYLNRLDLALQDVSLLLKSDPNNPTASEIAKRVKEKLDQRGVKVDDRGIILSPQYEQLPCPLPNMTRHKSRKHRNTNTKDKTIVEEHNEEKVAVEEHHNSKEEAKTIIKEPNEDKVVAEEHHNSKDEVARTVKLVFGEDIRWAQIPTNCSILQLREIIWNRFPSLKSALIKYKDHDGDFVTITSTEELRWAEASAGLLGSLRLYIVQVCAEKDPLFSKELQNGTEMQGYDKKQKASLNSANNKWKGGSRVFHIDDWIVQFAELFKNHVGLNLDGHLDLREIGLKAYSEALEDVITSEEAQDLFEIAVERFQLMTALALFNWGNIHMSRSRNRVFWKEDASKESASRESIIEQVKLAYECAKRENEKAGEKYKEAIKVKNDFYEGFLALGQQQFERAKLSWCYALGSNVDLNGWPSSVVINLFMLAEANITKGAKMWEQNEAAHLSRRLSERDEGTEVLWKMLEGLSKDPLADEAAVQAINMETQINLLCGTMLYDWSTIEFKLGKDVWKSHFDAAIEKFEQAEISAADIAVIRENHCSNAAAHEGKAC